MFCFTFLICALMTNGFMAIYVNFEADTNIHNIVKSVYVSPCPEIPCVMKKGDVFQISINFMRFSQIPVKYYRVALLFIGINKYLFFNTNNVLRRGKCFILRCRMLFDLDLQNVTGKNFYVGFKDENQNISEECNFVMVPYSLTNLPSLKIVFKQCDKSIYKVMHVGIDPCEAIPCALKMGGLVELTVTFNYGTSGTSSSPGRPYSLSVQFEKNNLQKPNLLNYNTDIVIENNGTESVTVLMNIPRNLMIMNDEIMKVWFTRNIKDHLSLYEHEMCFTVVVGIVS